MGAVALTGETFEATVAQDGIVLVDWWASWCGPCRVFAPIFEDAAAQHPDIVFAKVDTEAEQSLAQAAGIMSIPTVMAFRDGLLLFAGPLPATRSKTSSPKFGRSTWMWFAATLLRARTIRDRLEEDDPRISTTSADACAALAGQVQAIDRMLAEGRECREVVIQISAATKALEQAGFKLIAAGLTYCVERPEEAEADGYTLEEVERMFLKLA